MCKREWVQVGGLCVILGSSDVFCAHFERDVRRKVIPRKRERNNDSVIRWERRRKRNVCVCVSVCVLAGWSRLLAG